MINIRQLDVLKHYILKIIRGFEKRIFHILWFLKNHYTWLSVLVFIVTGGFLIFFAGWIFRYDRFDWWRWKQRAVQKFILYIFFLMASKFLLFYV